jgi:hypothetical protein
MQTISEAMQTMITSGRYLNPSARLVCDIDPPFVGKNFNQSGSYPSLTLHNDILYLVFIDEDNIKIAVVNPEKMAVTSMLRVISAPSATRPRLIFETSTYPGQADLPHVAYCNNLTEKVMVYREQYNEDLSINKITDEIGAGKDIEPLKIGDNYYHFYIGANGKIYQRKQGDYATVIMEPVEGETITGLWATVMPDARICLLYSVATDSTDEIRASYTNMMLPLSAGSDSFQLGSSLTSWVYKTGVFVFGANTEYQKYSVQDNGIKLVASLSILKIYMMGQIANESFELSASLNRIIFSQPIEIPKNIELHASLTKIVLSSPHEFAESFQLTASLQLFQIYTP